MSGIPPARRVIRLFPEYSRDWPLWENSTPTWDVGYTTFPETYGLSDGLTRTMAEWNTFWETHFSVDDGWDGADSQRTWRADGETVVARLREEVAAFADVSYEPWPLDDYVRHPAPW